MSLRRRSSRSVTLLVAAFLSAAVLVAAGLVGTDAAAAKPRPSPSPSPSPQPTPTPTPVPRCTVTGSETAAATGANGGLNDVEAISATDIWAVGSWLNPIQHWNGSSWSLVADAGAGGTQLFGVAAASQDDAWAVGSSIGAFGFSQALAEHWNGTSWSVVEGTPSGTTSKLSDVAVLASNDVWTVGSYASQATNNWWQPLVERWDGTGWRVVPSPTFGTSSELDGVAALGPNDVWAVGYTYATRTETLILHWDGSSWTRVASPNVGPYGNGLMGISAIAANDIWAVGVGNNSGITLTLHWNGNEWSVVPSPNSTNPDNLLHAVAARSANDAWAVGWSVFLVPVGEDIEYHPRALLMHWDGGAWRLFDPAAPSDDDNRRNGVDTLPDGEAWVVGSHAAQGSVIERYRCQ